MTCKPLLALRSALLYIAMSILSLIWCPLLYLSAPLPFPIRRTLFRAWSRGVLISARIFCGIRHTIEGMEHLPKKPVIFLSKHQSAWETLAFLSVLPYNCFVCKKSLLNIPVFGWGMRVGKHIPIDRSAGMKAFKQVIAQGKSRLAEGLSIVIFPEGTRIPVKQNPKFHKTAAALAKSAGSIAIPIAHNSGHYWPRKGWIKYPGIIQVVIGEPIDTSKHSVDEINELAHAWIKQQMQRLEQLP